MQFRKQQLLISRAVKLEYSNISFVSVFTVKRSNNIKCLYVTLCPLLAEVHKTMQINKFLELCDSRSTCLKFNRFRGRTKSTERQIVILGET